MDINTTFLKGRMNKSFDERVLPDGEYIDALNIRIGSTENNSVGAIENVVGNTQITTVMYNGNPLSSNARCIGVLEDGEHETLYWFVTDPGVVDMVLSYNERTETLVYHIISTSVLNFSTDYLVTGIDLIDGLLFWTDNYNPPRRINVNSSYPYPVAGVDSVTEDDISVIVAPPIESPTITPITISGEENYMSDKFISFSYRYKYKDGEYSALSQFSEIAFEPKQFFIDYTFYGNGAMQNLFNAYDVSFNTGSDNVVGIDLCFKLSDSSIVNVIERYNKQEEGWADNEIRGIVFDSKKIYTALPSSELNRLFDNVPRVAKSQTTMGNRLIYGNYVDGYDIDVDVDFDVAGVSDTIDISELQVTSITGEAYNINSSSPVEIPNSKIVIDFTGVDILANSILVIDVSLSHNSFGGSSLYDDEFAPQNTYNYTFSFNIQSDFDSAFELANDPGFIASVYESVAIADSCNGPSLTDNFNCNISAKSVIVPPVNGGWDKLGSGINAIGEGFTITSSPLEPNKINIQIPAMKFYGYDDVEAEEVYAYEYLSNANTIASITRRNTRKSLHSNRDYEVAIVYQDEYLRSSTALVSINNTVFFPAETSNKKNYIVATINSLAPSWATRYKFVVKPSKSNYETIYSSLFFTDASSFTWFKLEGDNISKVKVGDTLIVKADTSGYVDSLIKTKVLDVEAKSEDWVTGNGDTVEPGGVYMKLRASNFEAEYRQNSFIEPSYIRGGLGGSYRHNAIKMFYDNPEFDSGSPVSISNRRYIPYDIPAGSIVNIKLRIHRNAAGLDSGCGSYQYLYQRTVVATNDYTDFRSFIIGENVDFEQGIMSGGDELVGVTVNTQNNPLGSFPNTSTGSDGETLPKWPYVEPVETAKNYFQFAQTEEDGEPDGSHYFVVASGIPGCSGKKAYNSYEISIQQSNGTLVFETEPLEADGEIFFEGSESFLIVNGMHMSGDAVGDVNQTDSTPAVVTLNFFNCFSFGNGVESYKVNDSLTGDPFYLGERVTAVAQEEYKAAHRYATLTYSGIYNAETNINRLNEFNLSLANFKDLERSFGPINKLYGRRTDVLVLQEDKISYVLAGKNLLSDSTGGGQIASIPEVLGTQIARTEEYGISNNPESFAVYGSDVYFTDTKRSVVINLQGGSAQGDALNVISEYGMKYWFRDKFNEFDNTFKLGGYDPYMGEYVLSITTTEMPTDDNLYGCGVTLSKRNNTGTYQYTVDLGEEIGESTITVNMISGEAQFVVEYDEEIVADETYDTVGTNTIVITKSTALPKSLTVTIVSDNASFEVNVGCIVPVDYITVFRVVYNSPGNAGETIHNKYNWSLGPFTSPNLVDSIVFEEDGVSLFESQNGGLSNGMIPAEGSDVTLYSELRTSDTYIFNESLNSFKYLVSNTLYTPEGLIPVLNTITPITGEYQGTIPNISLEGYSYLYLVWDYRSTTSLTLCYDEVNPYVLCCECPVSDTFYIDAEFLELATGIWTDAERTTLAPDGYYSAFGTYRQMLSGELLSPLPCNGCEPQQQCFEGMSEAGGSITYIDLTGTETTISDILFGDVISIEFLDIVFYSGIEAVPCPLELGYRSNTGLSSPDDVCAEDLLPSVYIFNNGASPTISNGDIVCNTNDITDRFDGNFLYYKVMMAIGTSADEYVCQINNEGVITVISNCPEPL
jgi:hypothetical protein